MKVLGLLFICLFFMSCTRPEVDKSYSNVSLRIPKMSDASGKIGALSLPLPANKKPCFGVNVTGPGISQMPTSCGPVLGVYSGFAEEGANLELNVPNGTNRVFELFVYLAPLGTACPAYQPAFNQSSSNAMSTYASGKTIAHISADTAISITMEFPGESNNIKTTFTSNSCGGSLKGKLYSNGDVVDNNSSVSNESQAYLEGFYSSGLTDIFGIGYFSSTNILNPDSASSVQFPEEISSITRKPDTGHYYALLGGGSIVQLTISGSSGTYTALTAANCPFNVTNCKVPEWTQSISAGFGSDLFSLDHGGNIYTLSGDEANPAGITVEDFVTQVSFY